MSPYLKLKESISREGGESDQRRHRNQTAEEGRVGTWAVGEILTESSIILEDENLVLINTRTMVIRLGPGN